MGRCGHGHGGMMGHGMGFHGMGWLWRLKRLDLSEEQWKRLHAIKISAKKESIRKWADLKLAKIDLMQLLHEENVDRAKVEQAVRDLGQQGAALKLTMVNALLDALAVLTAEQRRKLWQVGMGGGGCCPMCGSELSGEEDEAEEEEE